LKKNILVIYYTQSGQIREILDTMLKPLSDAEDTVLHWAKIETEQAFPFPWSGYTFYDAFPESVFEIPCPVKPLKVDQTIHYDLVIIGYQPWFLSPSIPISSFLQSAQARQLLEGKQVLTVIGCRNLWLTAQESVKKRIQNAGGKLRGNISLYDRSNFLASVITILYWMLTAKRDRYLGIFPVPGVQKADVDASVAYGRLIEKDLRGELAGALQTNLVKAGAVEVKPHLMSLEVRGKRIFGLWAAFIRKKGGPGDPRRKWRLKAFSYYLPTVIFIASPFVFALTTLFNLFIQGRVKRKKRYYEGVELHPID
jgi:hypothetical protein